MKCFLRACLLRSCATAAASICVMALGGLLLCAGTLSAQPATGAPIPPRIGATTPPAAAAGIPVPTIQLKTNAAPEGNDQKLIERFITDRVASLGKDGGTARDDLIAGSTTNNLQNPATPGYLLIYTRVLNTQLLPLTTDANMRVRINAGIVAARVAANSGNGWLAPCAEKLLSPKQPEGVSLWGIKTANAVMGQSGNRVTVLTQLMAGAVKAHANCAVLADEAYNALNNISPPTRDCIDRMQDIYEIRANLYHGGLPDDPTVDIRPSTWLTNQAAQGMWTLSDKPRQTRTMQLIANLLAWGSAQADLLQPGEQRDQILFTLEQTCNSVMYVAGPNTPLGITAKGATRLPKTMPCVPLVQPVVDGIVQTYGVKAPTP